MEQTQTPTIMCTCCTDSRPLHFLQSENMVLCLASGNVYERRGGEWFNTETDSHDYERRRQEYINLEFPDEARPNIQPTERIDLSQYYYS